MRYKCISIPKDLIWLTVGNVYYGEVVISPVEFSGGKWLLLSKADDGHPCYVEKINFELYTEV